jgi:co-chaperonin GroES (HSP10)
MTRLTEKTHKQHSKKSFKMELQEQPTERVKMPLPKPLNDRVILNPNESRSRGIIEVPDTYRDGATSCLVMEVGKDVPPQIKVGSVVLCETGFGERKNSTINGTSMFWARASNIYAVIERRKIFPIGRKVLIKRDIEDTHVGGILIPANRRFQSLYGVVVRLGLTRKPFKTIGITVGSRIRLTGWQAHYANVELEDGSYGVIVNEEDILLREEAI